MENLPLKILFEVCKFFEFPRFLSFFLVNKHFASLANKEPFWRYFYIRDKQKELIKRGMFDFTLYDFNFELTTDSDDSSEGSSGYDSIDNDRDKQNELSRIKEESRDFFQKKINGELNDLMNDTTIDSYRQQGFLSYFFSYAQNKKKYEDFCNHTEKIFEFLSKYKNNVNIIMKDKKEEILLKITQLYQNLNLPITYDENFAKAFKKVLNVLGIEKIQNEIGDKILKTLILRFETIFRIFSHFGITIQLKYIKSSLTKKNIRYQDENGDTLLHRIVQEKYTEVDPFNSKKKEIIDKLLEMHANPLQKNKQGISPFDILVLLKVRIFNFETYQNLVDVCIKKDKSILSGEYKCQGKLIFDIMESNLGELLSPTSHYRKFLFYLKEDK